MRKKLLGAWAGIVVGAAAVGALIGVAGGQAPSGGAYRSPYDVAYSPDGKLIAVADRTGGAVLLIDKASGKVARQAAVAKPAALAWSADSLSVFVADTKGGVVAQIGAGDAKVAKTFAVGPMPNGVAIAAKKQLLIATGTALNDVVFIDLATGKEKKRVKAVREPWWVSVTPDESIAVVSNLLPAGAASEPLITSAVSLYDLDKLEKVADIPLPPNTTAIRQTAVSPDGKWAYAVHTVGRTTLPATQLERGWVNTNALSIIDLKEKKHFATLLMDNLSQGAADPWGIALSKDGATMWVTLAGVHQVAKIDLAGLHNNLQPTAPTAPAAAPAQPGKTGQPAAAPPPAKKSYSSAGVWTDIKTDPAKRAELVNDLAALYAAGLIQRINIPCIGPRGISLSPDGSQIAVGSYFSESVLLLNPADCKVAQTIALAPERKPDQVRQGEIVFHDARHAFQQWLSCATCHPNEARVDGMNWDLTNDGIGNPKNARSLLLASKTPPMMSMGVRDDMESAVAAGFRFAAFQPIPEDVAAVSAYLKSLTPEPSPYLVNGQLSEKAKRGKAIFESEKAKCAHCHSGEVFTNLKQFNVGTQGPLDHKEHTSFDTPTLIEVWRTGPYLHDGSAATLQDVITKHNPNDQHGGTSHLSKDQVEDLVEYLLSL